jgi:AbrB family looped-hinge helix DNA binding protein
MRPVRVKAMPFSMASGMINGMRLRLDKSGRVVLPKPLRQRLGLRAGTTFEAKEAPEGLLLRPIRQRPSLIERDGFLVHTGRAVPSLDWEQLSQDLEEERLRDILGQ